MFASTLADFIAALTIILSIFFTINLLIFIDSPSFYFSFYHEIVPVLFLVIIGLYSCQNWQFSPYSHSKEDMAVFHHVPPNRFNFPCRAYKELILQQIFYHVDKFPYYHHIFLQSSLHYQSQFHDCISLFLLSIIHFFPSSTVH